MTTIGFDNDKYLSMQSEKIKERISQFGGSFILNSEESFLMIIMLQEYFRGFSLTASSECCFK